jgi:hypothetical protein
MPTATLPIGMLKQESKPMNERGYTCVPDDWDYDPSRQVSSLYIVAGTSPTTVSPVAGTTGVFGGDSDESNDDKGTD